MLIVHDPAVHLWQAIEDVDHESKADGKVDLIINFIFLPFMAHVEDMALRDFCYMGHTVIGI